MKNKITKLLTLLLAVAAMAAIVASCDRAEDPKEEPAKTTAAATTAATTAKPTVYEEQTLNVSEHLDDVFRTLGRTYTKSDKRLYVDFSCSGIHFVADCEGSVQIQLFADRNNRFTVYVDGERMSSEPVVTASNSGNYITVATKLERGVHEFRIVNQTQFIWSQGAIGSVKITGEFREKPAERELFLEFYGDSIVNGSNVRMNGGGFDKTDATQAFAWVTAEKMNADMNLVGCSSIGLTKNSRNFFMKDLIEWSGAHCSAYAADKNTSLVTTGIPKYDFARVPDAVIIEQGVNDGSNASTAAFKTALTDMINTLRQKYGKDVPIVVLTGYTSSGAYNTSIPTIISDLGGEGANLYVCKLSNAAASKDIGGDGTHPNIESSKKMGDEISAFLEKILK